VGLRRTNNQDSNGAIVSSSEDVWQRRGHLFIVADGMGAHAAGELASKMAVDNVLLTYYKLPDPSPADALKKAVEDANTKIHTRGQSNPDFKGMGTTISSMAILPQGAIVAHVGDSRVYRLRGNRFEQLSADHSLVWEMMAASKITERDLPAYVPKNVITRSLGPNQAVQVDLEGPFPLLPGDTFLLCSDGLSGQVSDEELGAILQTLPPREATVALVELANLRGGPDNITVIITRVMGLPNGVAPGTESHSSTNASQPGAVHVATWVVMGVMLLVAGVLAVGDQLWGAIGAGVIAAGALLAAVVQRSRGSGGGSAIMPSGALGRGPYRSLVCSPNAEMLDRLSKLIDPVRQMAVEQQWSINWSVVDEHRQLSSDAAASGDYSTALREICRAMTLLMRDVRDQRRRA
jgi:protein phosphatase